MQKLGTPVAAHKARFVGVLAGTLVLAAAQTALAQNSPPTNNPVDNAPSEAARRAALSPYRFILQNAAPRKPAAAPAASTTAIAPAAAEPRKPAAPPVQQAAVQNRNAAPAPVEAA